MHLDVVARACNYHTQEFVTGESWFWGQLGTQQDTVSKSKTKTCHVKHNDIQKNCLEKIKIK